MSFEAEEKLRTLFQRELEPWRKRHIVFWYDPEQDFAKELAEYQLDDVEILYVTNHNYFATKYLIEQKETEKNFLLYFDSPRPASIDNPLLDIYLYSYEFQMDSVASLMDELKIVGTESRQIVEAYRSFFVVKKNKEAFIRLIKNEEQLEEQRIELAILCVLTKTKELRISTVLIQLLSEIGKESRELWKAVLKYAADSFFWQQMELNFGYKENEPSIESLSEAIFITKTNMEFAGKIPANWKSQLLVKETNSVIFLNQWMNRVDLQESYSQVALIMETSLKIDKFIKGKSIEVLIQGDTFKLYDQAILVRIAEQLVEGIIQYDPYEKMLMDRRSTYWFNQFSAEYRALIQATRLLKAIQKFDVEGLAFEKEVIWTNYAEVYYEIDTSYRKFYQAFDQINETHEVYWKVREMVENYYKNGYLTELSERWSQLVENEVTFDLTGIEKQTNFYQNYVRDFVAHENRVFIIISDALRYEAGVELADKMNALHRFNTTLSVMEGVVPSYTDMGMAALLPHHSLAITPKGTIEIDGQSTSGIEQRRKILQNEVGDDQATASHAKDLLTMSRAEMRKLYVRTTVNYIYHDVIDATGDHASSEQRVFSATQEAIGELERLITKLTVNVNAAHIIVTADHGYIYTRDSLKTIDKVKIPNEDALVRNRRFILNQSGLSDESLLTFNVLDKFVHIPKGNARFAIQGGGANYVHGGILPQEMMIPVLQIKTERGRDQRKQVDVQLISETNRLTNIVTYLDFLQIQPVTNDIRKKHVRVYLEDEYGLRISNELVLMADSNSEDAKERVMHEKLILFSKEYDLSSDYYLVMVNEMDPEEIDKKRFSIDLPKEFIM
ncbi:conserved hypothetical protein [Carnobacterium maltaromaticum]|uniref:BREX-1 system phosphatase PglZ type A n=1 Tax=Carnobacterium maltaromaticum TaxID=2751 RepID=UPI00191BA0B0|nr:BREX-1 system phosphatase PglZ type A [Carnobacterium maltaromaticum]CAD5896240.1 conserved hypothetical protein [Carnobacterium maltaromaticum]